MKRRCMSESRIIKKGPWSAEEDEVLINFVNKNGPRDWSSIQSKGLLPRTGKSCRLRWVNKLRPNLKVGCKFSAEEERIVVELQAKFGNKWATIASHLQGRTDNDVKNFWSSRKKRLARTLECASEPSNKQPCRKQKSAIKLPSDLEVPESSNSMIQVAQPSSSSNPLNPSSQPSNVEIVSSLPELTNSLVTGSQISTKPLLSADSSALLQETSGFLQQSNVAPLNESSWSSTLSYSSLPLLSDPYQIKDLDQVFAEPTSCWQLSFPCTSSCDLEMPFFGGSTTVGSYSKSTTALGTLSNNPDGFFDDFPTDLFD